VKREEKRADMRAEEERREPTSHATILDGATLGSEFRLRAFGGVGV
jgi:hypothetical protein